MGIIAQQIRGYGFVYNQCFQTVRDMLRRHVNLMYKKIRFFVRLPTYSFRCGHLQNYSSFPYGNNRRMKLHKTVRKSLKMYKNISFHWFLDICYTILYIFIQFCKFSYIFLQLKNRCQFIDTQLPQNNLLIPFLKLKFKKYIFHEKNWKYIVQI